MPTTVALLAPVSWGSVYFVIGHPLSGVGPAWGAALRAGLAGLVLLALAPSPLPRSAWRSTLVVGLLTNGGFFVLMSVAAQRLPSSVAATLSGAAPLLALGWSWLLLGRRPSTAVLTAGGTGVLGVVLLVGAAPAALDPVGTAAGLGAVAAFTSGTTLSYRWREHHRSVPGVSLVGWQLLSSGLLVLPFAVLVDGHEPRLHQHQVTALAYVVLIVTALAFCCWDTGVRRWGVVAMSLVGLLNPVTGVVLGLVLAGERFTLVQAVGLLLTSGSVAAAASARRTDGRLPVPDHGRDGARSPHAPTGPPGGRTVATAAT
jgi:probable blue pigment (indigoidine) exporter